MASASKATKASGEAGDTGVDAGSAGKATGPETGDVTAASASGQPIVDLEFVRGLIDAVDQSGIDSLEITRAGTRVKISKTPPAAGPAATYLAGPPPPHAVAAGNPAPGPVQPSAAPSGPETGGAAETDEASESVETSGLVDVTSPMVGTFYRAPAPEAPPYVEVGSRVTKGQTLCILEAMKLMNELEAEQDGVIREVLVENAEPVEYGQPLFRIDPNG